MRTVRASLVAAAAVTLGGCNLDLTNPNQPTVASTLTNPRASISRMVVGVVGNYRDNRALQIRALGSFGRETYYMFITDGRFITGPYRDWKQNNSFEAGTQWGARYQNRRNAYAAMAIIIGFQAVVFAVFTKVFAMSEGLLPEDPRFNRMFRFINLEVGLVVGCVLLLMGLGGSMYALRTWGAHAFGPLDPSKVLRTVIPATTSFTLGFQIILSSFFLSVLGLRRR